MSMENNFKSWWNKYYIDFNEKKIKTKLVLAVLHKRDEI